MCHYSFSILMHCSYHRRSESDGLFVFPYATHTRTWFFTVLLPVLFVLCFHSYISKVDVLKILVTANYKYIPSLDDILETSAVTRLRNQLLEAEHYQLAVEVRQLVVNAINTRCHVRTHSHVSIVHPTLCNNNNNNPSHPASVLIS